MKLLLFPNFFCKNQKAVSGIIATIFLVLIVLFLYSNVYLFILNQNASFQEDVSDVNEADAMRNTEKIVTTNVDYIPYENGLDVEVQIINNSPVLVEITTLWVVDSINHNYGYNNSLNISLKAGESFSFQQPAALKVPMDVSDFSYDCVCWFVTNRGNLVSLEKEEEIVVAQISQGIGSLALDLEEFRYFTYETDQKLLNYPDGNLSFNIPKNSYVAFGCQLTNLDPSMKTITVDSHSLFWQPGRSGVAEGTWFIVNVLENGSISHAYSEITINYGEAKMLVFASQNDMGLGAFSRLRTANAITTVASFILLHGTIGSKAYAQNIPYVSLYYN